MVTHHGVISCKGYATEAPLCVGACELQVALMRVLDSAIGAMEAHRGVTAITERGLGLLWNLASDDGNRVSVTDSEETHLVQSHGSEQALTAGAGSGRGVRSRGKLGQAFVMRCIRCV